MENELTNLFVLSGCSGIVICSGLDVDGVHQPSSVNTGCEDVMHLDRW